VCPPRRLSPAPGALFSGYPNSPTPCHRQAPTPTQAARLRVFGPKPIQVDSLVKPFRFPAQPHEYKVVALHECPTPDQMYPCDTPDKAAAYWRSNVTSHPYFNPQIECMVVFMLNTRTRAH